MLRLDQQEDDDGGGEPSAAGTVESSPTTAGEVELWPTFTELQALVRVLQSPDSKFDVQPQSRGVHVYPPCFPGCSLVDWLLANYPLVRGSRERSPAVRVGRSLLQSGLLQVTPICRCLQLQIV